MTICKWTEHTANDVLVSLTSSHLLHLYSNCETLNQKFNALLEAKFPSNDALKYYTQLTTLRQCDYLTIEEYKTSIEEVCKKLSICKKWNVESTNSKVEESFYNGLSRRTQLEMARLNVKSLGEMYQIIFTTESTMIEQIKANSARKKKVYDESPKHYNNNFRSDKSEHNHKQRKYCKLHKTSSHGDEECRAQNKLEHKKSGSNTIKEPKSPKNFIELEGKIDEKRVKVLFDTGSTYNYINKNIIKELNKKPIDTETNTVELANGSNVAINQEIKLKMHLEADTSRTYNVTFKIMQNLTTDIILGLAFLFDNESIIDMKEGILTIDGKHYEFPTYSDQSYIHEKFIADKTKIMLVKSPKECVEELIKKCKIENPILGTMEDVDHNIILNNETPVISKPYPIPHTLKNPTRIELNRLLNLGIIKESKSAYCSPAFPLLKKNGDIRLVIDYRKLNAVTIPMNYPIPRINDYLQELGGSKVFSQIDLNMGYYQIPVAKEDTYKTAFSLDKGHYEFLRMPFGLSNAPRTFQHAMNKLFKEFTYVKVYLDDILVNSPTEEIHCLHLQNVLNILKNQGIAINFSKSNLFKNEVVYFGHLISSDGIKADISRVSTFENYILKTAKQLQRTIGLINWFRLYIKNLSIKMASLIDKIKKNKKFV
jgi:hypothetical protein